MRSVWWNRLTDRERAEIAELTGSPPATAPDLLVVGAGLVGLCTAWYAADRGLSVVVIDAGDALGEASGASFGGVWPNELGSMLDLPDDSPAAEAFQELAFSSRDLWGRLSVRPGFEIDWQVNGFLQVDAQRLQPTAEAFTERALNRGYSLAECDAEQVATLEPALAPCPHGGVRYPSEARLNPLKAGLALIRGIRQKGGRVVTHAAARSLQTNSVGDQLEVVVETPTAAITIRPKAVVAASGANLSWLGERANLVPVRPTTSEAVATGPVAPLLTSTIGGRFLVQQLRTGEVIAGGTTVEGRLDQPRPATIQEIIAATRQLIPALANVEFPSAWCGARSSTPDGQPILDLVPGTRRVWLAVGHHRAGILLATGTGRLLADWIADDQAPGIDAFRLARFS